MAKILEKQLLAPNVYRFLIESPLIARKRKAGQFIILRLFEGGERVPMSIADADPEKGTLTIVVQEVGKTTAQMVRMKIGDDILDIVGPLGKPTHIENFGTAVCIGGGIGIAPIHPIAQALKAAGNYVISILGGRSKEFVIMENEMRTASSEVIICTDDGSYGEKGLVTQLLQKLIDSGRKIDYVIAIGPAIMMKFVSELTRKYGIMTYVSLNSIMVDGTGMCGCCRVSYDGKTKFVCVDGPELNGHLIDFDELMKRQAIYKLQEQRSHEQFKMAIAAKENHTGGCCGGGN